MIQPMQCNPPLFVTDDPYLSETITLDQVTTLDQITMRTLNNTFDKINKHQLKSTSFLGGKGIFSSKNEPEFFNLSAAVEIQEPAMLWKASLTNYWQTGCRPHGESMKLNGVWWRIEKLSEKSIRKIKEAELLLNSSLFDAPFRSFSVMRDENQIATNLQRAMDSAIQNGISREKIIELLDHRIVANVMEL